MRSGEKPADEESSRHRFLAWVLRHPDWPSGRRLQRVEETGRYCWPTSFKVLGVLFLGEASSAFWPSKKACWTHQFQCLGVGQQYPPVSSTRWSLLPEGQSGCRRTHAKNLCLLDSSSAGFSTLRILLGF